MGVLVMVLDRVDMSDTNNNITGLSSCPVFHWPQHSFLVEHFRDSRLPLSCELQRSLRVWRSSRRRRQLKPSMEKFPPPRGIVVCWQERKSGLPLTSSFREIGRDC